MAQNRAFDKSFLDSLAFATTELRIVTDNYLAFRRPPRPERLAGRKNLWPDNPTRWASKWYNEEYDALYGRLTAAIKNS